MDKVKIFTIGREKHLDHMVKVVPFIVFLYAIQCYVIYRISPTEFSSIGLTVLGAFLAMMVAGFVGYDLKHKVTFFENELQIEFLNIKKTIPYREIWSTEINEPGQSFATVGLETAQGKYKFYFVDEADKIKSFLEDKKQSEFKKAA